MIGQRVGYVRVSSFDQNPERQLEDVDLDRTFSDKASGKDVKRPQLEALMTFVRAGDTVVVHSMDRLARNLDDLRRIVQTLTRRGIRIEFVKGLHRFRERGEDRKRNFKHVKVAARPAFGCRCTNGRHFRAVALDDIEDGILAQPRKAVFLLPSPDVHAAL